MKFGWATDVHFDCLEGESGIVAFAANVQRAGCDGLLLTGDISTGREIVRHLTVLERALALPIYFVAGNHDFYGTSVRSGREQLNDLSRRSKHLRYMPSAPFFHASGDVALVGHDGWYDAMNGDWRRSNFLMNDWRKISEFHDVAPWNPAAAGFYGPQPSMAPIVSVARKLSYEAVQHVEVGIAAAVQAHKTIVILTHVPPWHEAAWHDGRPQDVGHVPWYTSKLMGDAIVAAAARHPKHEFVVLCGHTHSRWSGKIRQNISVHVGAAEYGAPQVQPLFVEIT
jgi:3',5'-cyclic AMP phosphodiesterase CpdA